MSSYFAGVVIGVLLAVVATGAEAISDSSRLQHPQAKDEAVQHASIYVVAFCGHPMVFFAAMGDRHVAATIAEVKGNDHGKRDILHYMMGHARTEQGQYVYRQVDVADALNVACGDAQRDMIGDLVE